MAKEPSYFAFAVEFYIFGEPLAGSRLERLHLSHSACVETVSCNGMTVIDLNKLKQKLETLLGDDYDFEVADYLLTIKFDGKPLNDLQRQVVSTNILDNEVFNGGFDQFYLNSSDKYIEDAIEGLRKFGTPEFLDLAIKSKEIFHRDKELFKDKRNPHFDPLDDKFYELPHYGESRIAFVKANIDKILV